MSLDSINLLSQEVYKKLLKQAKTNGNIKTFRISKDLQKKSESRGILKKLGVKTVLPTAVILSAAVMLFVSGRGDTAAREAGVSEIETENKIEDLTFSPIRYAAAADINELTESANDHYKETYMNKLADKLYARYKIEKGLSLYNNKLTAQELSDLSSAILKASEQFQLPPELITGIVITESRGRRMSKSWAGAYGPMQVMYSIHGKTLKKFGVNKAEDLYNVEKGILSGSWIFKGYMERCGNNVRRALARYYGANSRAYCDGTLKRAATVKGIKIPQSITEPNAMFTALNLNDEQKDRFYRMVYASSLGDGLTLRKAAAWLTADSPELDNNEKSKTLALLRYFGRGENGRALTFPKTMMTTARLQMKLNGEEKYLKKIGANLLHAHVVATEYKTGHDLFLECAMRAKNRMDEVKKSEIKVADGKKDLYAAARNIFDHVSDLAVD